MNDSISQVTQDDCPNCEPTSGFYLGASCQFCHKPFRKLKQSIPVIVGTTLNVEIYNMLNELSNSVGKTITEYHWRELCDLMRRMKEENMITINWKNNN